MEQHSPLLSKARPGSQPINGATENLGSWISRCVIPLSYLYRTTLLNARYCCRQTTDEATESHRVTRFTRTEGGGIRTRVYLTPEATPLTASFYRQRPCGAWAAGPAAGAARPRAPGSPAGSLRRALPPEPPAFRRPRPLTRSSSARSAAGRMRCPLQRPPSSAQAAHTGRRSEQQNQFRAWPCSGQSGPGSDPGPGAGPGPGPGPGSGPGPDPGPGPGPSPALSADMAERRPGAARSTCRRWLLGRASLTPPPGPGGRPARGHRASSRPTRAARRQPAQHPRPDPWLTSHRLQPPFDVFFFVFSEFYRVICVFVV